MTRQRNRQTPFHVRNGRAMVSLGPLAPTRFCSFNCPFCYVHSGFNSYASMTVEEITMWLAQVSEPFDVIYVSGDTDSFAHPRSDEGVALLNSLSQFDVDLLFTTRALLATKHIAELERLRMRLEAKGRLLFGCVSVSQLTFPHLEPKPIPPAAERLKQLRRFHESGLVAVLAARPFLPTIPAAEYLRIVDSAAGFADIVLGERWYADQQGLLERKVFGSTLPPDIPFDEHAMDFDDSSPVWKVFKTNEIQAAVSERCSSLGLPFFMRSRPAIDWARNSMATRR